MPAAELQPFPVRAELQKTPDQAGLQLNPFPTPEIFKTLVPVLQQSPIAELPQHRAPMKIQRPLVKQLPRPVPVEMQQSPPTELQQLSVPV